MDLREDSVWLTRHEVFDAVLYPDSEPELSAELWPQLEEFAEAHKDEWAKHQRAFWSEPYYQKRRFRSSRRKFERYDQEITSGEKLGAAVVRELVTTTFTYEDEDRNLEGFKVSLELVPTLIKYFRKRAISLNKDISEMPQHARVFVARQNEELKRIRTLIAALPEDQRLDFLSLAEGPIL